MHWLADIKTRTKLFLGFGVMLVLLVVIIVISYRGISQIHENERELFEQNYATAMDIKQCRINQREIRITAFQMVLTKDPQKLQKLRDEGDELVRENQEVLARLLEREKGNAALFSTLKEYGQLLTAYGENRATDVVTPILEGRVEAATEVLMTVQAELGNKIATVGLECDQIIAKEASTKISESSQIVSSTYKVFMLAGFLSFALSLTIIFVLTRLIAAPVNLALTAVTRIAAGDLSGEFNAQPSNDEIGQLMGAMNQMVINLKKQAGGLAEAVNVLSASASEIVATTTQLASNASETAVSANETTTTVEEVRQTATVSSQKAKYVSESAQKASQVAKMGRKAVEDTMESMTGIKEKMETVAESIVTLSEQSQAIGEIIAAVDDIAEQTNLLAVNASIEAVRAGEQGKGFSVVAQEIKALADQSKQATKRVRSILNDIQKATGKAVMATEEGSKTVDAGARLSVQSGENIQALADAIAEAAQAAVQIAASNQQQLAGMDQVVAAMENVKTASAQNAVGAKQMETATHNLSELGNKLKELVSWYRLSA